MRVTFAEQINLRAERRVKAAFDVAHATITLTLSKSRVDTLRGLRSQLKDARYNRPDSDVRNDPFKRIETELRIARTAITQSEKLLKDSVLDVREFEERDALHWHDNRADYFELAVSLATIAGKEIITGGNAYIVDMATNERLFGMVPHDPLGALEQRLEQST